MKKLLCVTLTLIMLLSLSTAAFAVNEDVEGELVIYTSMYKEIVAMMDEALKKEFPNLKPGLDGSFFCQGGTGTLITKIYGEMGDKRDQPLECDMLMVAEPAFSLELKDYGYLHSFEVKDADNLLRFPYDKDGFWYPVRVCNMVLAYNPELADRWAEQGVTVPKTFKAFAADRSLKGHIAMGDPMSSGTTFAAIASLTQTNHYGRAYLQGLAENKIQIISGSESIKKIRSGEIAAAMILEESVLKALSDAEESGAPASDLACIYPEDGVILIPSTVMTVSGERSLNGNAEACKAVEKWFLSEEAQKLILRGFMHSTFRTMDVNWENVYKSREEINLAWMDIVANWVSTDE